MNVTSEEYTPPKTIPKIYNPSTSQPYLLPKSEEESDDDSDKEENSKDTSVIESNLRNKMMRLGILMIIGLNLEMKVGVRRAIHQLRFNHHKYLPPYFPLSLLKFPSLNCGGTQEYRPYITKISPSSLQMENLERNLFLD